MSWESVRDHVFTRARAGEPGLGGWENSAGRLRHMTLTESLPLSTTLCQPAGLSTADRHGKHSRRQSAHRWDHDREATAVLAAAAAGAAWRNRRLAVDDGRTRSTGDRSPPEFGSLAAALSWRLRQLHGPATTAGLALGGSITRWPGLGSQSLHCRRARRDYRSELPGDPRHCRRGPSAAPA